MKDKELQDSQWVIEKNVKKDGDKDRLIVLPDLPDYLQDSSAGGSPATGRRSFASFNPSVEVCRSGLWLWASPYRYGSALQENMKQVLDEVQSDFRGKRALEEETSQEEMAEMYVFTTSVRGRHVSADRRDVRRLGGNHSSAGRAGKGRPLLSGRGPGQKGQKRQKR